MNIRKETLREAIGTLLGRLRAFEPEDDDLAVDEVIAALPHLAQPSKSDGEWALEIENEIQWCSCDKCREFNRETLRNLLTTVRAEASATEREACAKVAEDGPEVGLALDVAAAIRARKL